MTAQAFLQDLEAQGVIVSAVADRLDIDGPDSAVTDDLLDTLRARKAELLALLRSAVFVTFYDGRRIRIPQQSTPPGWVAQF